MVQSNAARRDGSFPLSRTNLALDANALSMAVAKVFRHIEPWYKVSHDDKHVDVIVNAVLIQSQRFKAAIDLSVNTSEHGLQLLAESALFAKAAARGRPIEEMQPDFGNLVRLASDGFDRLVRSSEILGEVSGRFQELGSVTGPLVAQRVPNRKQRGVQLSEGLYGVARAAGGAVMYSTMPPLVTFPVPLPEPPKVGELGVNGLYQAPSAYRDQENVLLDQALSRLNEIATDITQVQGRMARFVDSWKVMKERLAVMQSQIRQKDAVVGEQLGNEVEGDWADAVEQYKLYKDKVNIMVDYYQINFQVNCSEIDFTTILRNLGVHAKAMRTAIGHMESIVKLTHSGEGRRQFQNSVDSMQEKLSEQFFQLIPILEEFKEGVKSSGGVLDTEPKTRQELVKLLGRTETCMPLVIRDIHKLGDVLEEQVSTKRLYRAQFHYMFSSNSDEPGVYSQEDAIRILVELGEAALGVSIFCEVLVLVGVVLDEACFLAERPRNSLEDLENALESAIQALSGAKGTLSSDEGSHLL